MATDSTDVLMKFKVLAKSDRIDDTDMVPAEGSSAFENFSEVTRKNATDPLMLDFEPGYYFEVDSFDFGVSVLDSDDAESSGLEEGSGERGNNDNYIGGPRRGAAADQKGGGKRGKPAKRRRQFKKFIDMPTGRVGDDLDFSIDIDAVKFTRQMDKASPIFFKHCVKKKPFKQVTLVKRKMTGNRGFHETFLRMDFFAVLLTKVEWDDGDEYVKETCQFIFRKVHVQYKPQAEHGALGKPIFADWEAIETEGEKVQGVR